MAEERRLVTVLFADVVGSTAMAEELDPEDVRALLGRLFSIAREVIEQHGGQVEKFIGDAIMAVFGLPIAHDDDPARALSAALALRDRVREDPDLRERLAIRLGVSGGEVIATRDADAREFMVTGDPVNSAARLQQGADTWAIVVGDRTVGAVSDRFEFGPGIQVEAKGKSRPIAARVLLGPADATRRARHATRIVGREADLAQLELTAQRALDERRPYLVSIVAAAGVGKSRLLEEFLERRPSGAHVALAQCLPYGQRLTYWPVRAILLSIIELADDTPPSEIRARLSQWLDEAGDPEPERTGELLAATIGAAEVESVDRIDLFEAWRRFIELAAARTPLILVIEDLHWSSDSLLDLIEAILQPRADVPLLMIALARPELLDRRPSWGGGRRNAVSLALEPLGERAVAELVGDLLESPSVEIVDAVVRRAEGNPFYAGEIVRSLVDQLGPTPDPASAAAAIATLPDTIQATVLARIDALEPAARRVVQLGAVLGRTFASEALPALEAGLTAPDAAVAIDALLDRDLIRASGRGLMTFRHILIREVAYSTLPRSERARLHAAAGAWLEREAGATDRTDELAELVAFHLREAATLANLLGQPTEPDLASRAVRWLRLAADAAAAGAAVTEAARHLNAAIELAPRDLHAGLYERLGEVWSGGEQGLDAFEQANALGHEFELGSEQELRTLAQALIVAARWTGSIGRRRPEAETERRLQRIRELAAEPMPDRVRALGDLALAFAHSNLMNDPGLALLAEADAAARRAHEIALRLDDPDLLSAALDARSAVALGDDRVTVALEYAATRQELGDRLATAERLDLGIMTAWLESLRGNLVAAERAALEARRGLAAGQASAWSLGASAWRMLDLHALGQWDEVLAEAHRAETLWHESEIRAPWFALNGFLAAMATARSRGEPVTADHFRDLIRTIFGRSDPSIRTQRLAAYVDDDLDTLERSFILDFRAFSGRLDYVYLALALLADRRHPVDLGKLGDLIDYMDERDVALVGAQARRLRGLIRRDGAELRGVLDEFAAMGAMPARARVMTELGLVSGDATMIDAGIEALELLGDIEQARRVVAERASGPAGA